MQQFDWYVRKPLLNLNLYMEQNTLFNTEVSRRYSKALFKVASKENSEQVIYDEVSSLLDLFKSNDIFAKLFLSPLLSSKSQLKLVNNLFSNTDKKKINVSKNVLAFLKVLAKNGRLKILLGSLYSFQNLVKSMHKEVNINLTTAFPISEDNVNKIKNILLKKTDKKINIISNVDKNIIGGIILQSGSSLIDASIRNKILKLNNIKKGVN
ncbi:MAG: ATP synthase subunit delta [Alphaproteobacteria bacterium]|nr:MAG: ATP synthase subunit delta [Alphaproteobacteria bacterium]